MSKNYSFDLIAKTGDSVPFGEGSTDSLGKLGNSPSINDYDSIVVGWVRRGLLSNVCGNLLFAVTQQH